MSKIDWDDPEFCKHYQYRDGSRIVGVHSLPPLFAQLTPYQHRTTDGTEILTHFMNGRRYTKLSDSRDVVPIPREPRRGEGWAWVPSDRACFVVTDNPRECSYVVAVARQKPVRIKWEEVIE